MLLPYGGFLGMGRGRQQGKQALVWKMLQETKRIKSRQCVQLAGRALRSLMLVIWISKRILLTTVTESH